MAVSTRMVVERYATLPVGARGAGRRCRLRGGPPLAPGPAGRSLPSRQPRLIHARRGGGAVRGARSARRHCAGGLRRDRPHARHGAPGVLRRWRPLAVGAGAPALTGRGGKSAGRAGDLRRDGDETGRREARRRHLKSLGARTVAPVDKLSKEPGNSGNRLDHRGRIAPSNASGSGSGGSLFSACRTLRFPIHEL